MKPARIALFLAAFLIICGGTVLLPTGRQFFVKVSYAFQR